MSDLYVVVILRGAKVQCVLGPWADLIDAQANRDIVRLSGERTASVHKLRMTNVCDAHGETNDP